MLRRSYLIALTVFALIGCQTNDSLNPSPSSGQPLWILTETGQLFAKPGMTGSSFVSTTRSCMDIVFESIEKQGLSSAMASAVARVSRTDTFPKCMKSKGYDLANVSSEIIRKLPNGETDTYYSNAIQDIRTVGELDGVDRWPEVLANGDVDDLKLYLEAYKDRIYMPAAEIRYEFMKKQ